MFNRGKWHRRPIEWIDGENAFISVVFTWQLPEVFSRCVWFRSQGYRVHVGGPGVFTQRKYLENVADHIGGDLADAVVRHNPMATFASRGCPVGCWFCIVPKLEGKTFTEIENFTVRPVLCDNNLSALSPEYQDHIVRRYIDADLPLLDANSGFEPETFTDEVFARWKVINKGPWRFAYDETGEREAVKRVLWMLRDVRQKKKRVYVLIGNEPFDACLERVHEVISWGGDPHVQPVIKLNALQKKPIVRFDWSDQLLRDVARWTNGWVWKKVPFSQYSRSKKTNRSPESERLAV
jgi:hypothetical protein